MPAIIQNKKSNRLKEIASWKTISFLAINFHIENE